MMPPASRRPLIYSLTLAVALACVVLSPRAVLYAQDAAPSLDLPQRRALKQYQETKFPEQQRRINEAAKFDLPLEIQWEAMAEKNNGEGYLNDDYFTNVYFVPLAEALRGVTADATGAAALKAKLKRVVFACDKDAASDGYDQAIKFKDGTLTIDWAPFTNPQDRDRRTQTITAVLNKAL